MGKVLFSRPAGVFIQLIAAVIVFAGIADFVSSKGSVVTGIFKLLIGGVLLFLGGRTKARINQ